MQFNLIDKKWIPVKRRDGTPDMIAPWEVTDLFAENPVVSLNAPRPDFNGALIQFLIGLVQTVAAPANRMEWKEKLNKPPESEELKTIFASVRHAFELSGDGPRFMQDLEKFEADEGCIDGLLIDMPGDSTRKMNKDHFVKRNTVARMCPTCCATALFTMQTNAPEGGRGYLTSLRGGGPLTTLVLGDERHSSLWHSIWLNTLVNDDFLRICGNSDKNTDSDKFPWLGKTRTGVKTAPIEVHPAQMYWGMPRRIRLNLEKGEQGQCDICGIYSDDLIVSYKEKIQGNNYKGAWLHPLSPFFYKNNAPSAIHAQPGGVSYRNWLGFVQEDSSNQRVPARIVHEFREVRMQSDWQFRLWAFGYDMTHNNARCWYDSVMPIITVNPDDVKNYENETANLIRTADIICGNTKIAIKRATQGRPQFDSLTRNIKWKYQDIKKIPSDEQDERKKVLYAIKDQSTFMAIDVFFWQSTEKAFYVALYSLKKAFEVADDSVEIYKTWHGALCKASLELFDFNFSEGLIEDVDPKRVVLARRELERFNSGNKIKELLTLPVEQKPVGKEKKKKAQKV
ncbi:MAG: type I-E CRISPR-associated protein Cse1/CasA [Deltaproteobacteria bacterium CG12_big_fil_rev_8_21_14_0_65_43_10]|nr:MAG: type I-E CRISPR-associated protein Cse1/CasA [Deltaproteobacteria bacterium CG12_big_fil_rev_8_21_14_0_65_43_10]PIZ20121.1 MAG: type I-E CRISPR-associated protein Cse1/CasA [Deltaproteobacteria bacterium CG_4_10_14_0_8_um_filter_43_12]HCX89032.1 type I-E CRISPR-associated protein Cse1/CasA [Deltaproteobacteria bacterium]